MRGPRFDAMTKGLAAAGNRRLALRLMAGAALGGLLARPGPAIEVAARRCRKLGKKCERGDRCCRGRCKKGRCRCRKSQFACQGDCCQDGVGCDLTGCVCGLEREPACRGRCCGDAQTCQRGRCLCGDGRRACSGVCCTVNQRCQDNPFGPGKLCFDEGVG